MTSCILYENRSSTILIIDIPKSIEAAQGETKTQRRLLSTEPLQHPFPSLEPKSIRASANLGKHSLDDLLIQKRLDFALDELREQHNGEWCLPRVTVNGCSTIQNSSPGRKRRRCSDERTVNKPQIDEKLQEDSEANAEEQVVVEADLLFYNPNQQTASIQYGPGPAKVFLPPKSTALCGDVTATQNTFVQRAPKFDVIIMDPPWPNRSARRKKGYGISYKQSDIRTLLSLIPVSDHLTEDGFVGVWITNKPAFRDLTLQLFHDWGVGLVEELIWLKVTVEGKPICALDSRWKKPYEILLIAKKGVDDHEIGRRVLVAVPDLHSRKPNLKEVFQKIMRRKEEEYEALEVFARSLTAGWWGWGNEVLKFQEQDYWIKSAM